jgi:signal transduction histidine kinase
VAEIPFTQDAHQTGLLGWVEQFAQQGIFTTDAHLVIRSWNHWLEVATRYPAAEVVGRRLADALPDLVARGFEPYYRAALEGEVSVLAHALHRVVIAPRDTADRGVRQSGRIVPLVSDGTIVGTITIIDDVSERVASERELRAQIEASEQARRLAEEAVRVKDEFLTTLSHEIRTPLNAVLGWTRILMTRSADPATLARALEIINRNAESQARLIEDMLDTARIMSGKLRLEPRLVDLGRVALAAVDVVAPTAAAKGVQLHTEIGDDPVTMKGDPDRLQQVVWNLLSNAIKFTEAGGRVTVAVRSTPPGVLTLTVTDTGEGIPEAFLPQLFERFRQADPSAGRRHGGLGIGLSLVRQLVELHGGRIAARSTVGEGATFSVTFPAWIEEFPSNAKAPDAPSLEHVRVLVVGDDEDSRELLTVALGQSGAEVTAVAEAREAMALLQRADARERPQAIVADVRGGEHLSLARQLREASLPGRAIPAVAVISTDHVITRQRVQDAGFQVVVAKPISPNVLAAAVRDASESV